MAPYRRSAKRISRRKKPAYKPKVSTAVKKYVRKYVGPQPELKCLWLNDKEYNMDTLANQAYVRTFTELAQGSNRYSRVGNQVYFKGVQIKGVVRNNVAKTNYCRLIVARCNGNVDLSVASSIEIFAENLAGTGAGASSITGLEVIYGSLNKNKFKILLDKKMKLGASGSTDGADAKMFNHFVKLNQLIKYEGNGYGQDNQTYQLFWMLLAAEAADDAAGSTVVELSHTTKSWFSDI